MPAPEPTALAPVAPDPDRLMMGRPSHVPTQARRDEGRRLGRERRVGHREFHRVRTFAAGATAILGRAGGG